MKKVLVVGSSNVDFVVQVEEMPQKGETIAARTFHKVPGGKGANQACAVGRLGGDCTFLTAVGRDDLADLLRNSLVKAGVNLDRVLHSKELPTGMAMISVDQRGENSIVIVHGANDACDCSYLLENSDVMEEIGVLLVQLEIPMEAVCSAIHIGKERGCITILNPAPAPEKIPTELLRELDFITPNETELHTLTGMPVDTLEEIGKAADVLLQKGVGNVLVTIGSRGVYLCNRQGAQRYPSYPVKPVDTTAAGDTFNGGLAVGLASELPLGEAVRFANAAAALSTTKMGAQSSIPSFEEVEKLISEEKQLGK